MDNRRNQITLGVILLIIGAAAVFNPFRLFGVINVPAVLAFLAGVTFLFMYKMKRKGWALLAGAYLAYFGGVGLLSLAFRGTGLLPRAYAQSFFAVPAIVFFVLYFDKNRSGLLIPASFLLWFGLFIILRDIPFIAVARTLALFELCVAGACFTVYECAKRRGELKSKAIFYAGVFFAALGVFGVLKPYLYAGVARLFPLILIAVGAFIIFRAVRK